jgi:dethiobiotin synthetase
MTASAKQPLSALFVTGTDTGVGKTFVCGALWRYLLGRGLKVGYQKWVSTGGTGIPDDLQQCLTAAGLPFEQDSLEHQVPYRFRLPASPHLAAEQEGRRIDPELILERFHYWVEKHDLLLVEGVGGLLVPLRRDLLLVDLLVRLRLPTLIVARSGLGTLNQTLLTLEALRARQIPVLGVVFSDAMPAADELLVQDNLRTIAETGKVRVFGRIRHGGMTAADEIWQAIAGAMKIKA